MNSQMTPIVKNLLIINVLFYMAQFAFPATEYYLSLWPLGSGEFKLYQLITTGFLHSTRDIWHLGMNMFELWMFGKFLENVLGSKKFLTLYMVSLIGASLLHIALSNSRAIGASGAVMGVLIGFALLFPNMKLFLMFFPFPIKAKYLAMGLAALDIIGGFTSYESGIAHFAHLGGMIAAVILIKLIWKIPKIL